MEILSMPGGSVPASPRRFLDAPFDFQNHYTSAPTSPARAAAIYAHFAPKPSPTIPATNPTSHVPFDWEITPGTPKSRNSALDDDSDTDDEMDFSFDVTRHNSNNQGSAPKFSAADELFEAGKIRPLKLPPRLLYHSTETANSSPRTPRSRGRRGDGEFDPFIAAMVETTRDPNSRSRKASSRSLSPFRGRSFFNKEVNNEKTVFAGGSSFNKEGNQRTASGSSVELSGGADGKRVGKKWRLKDFLLFRSASEGERSRLISSSSSSDSANGSFRSSEERFVGRRAVLKGFEEDRRFAYKQRLFGCLRINNVCKRI